MSVGSSDVSAPLAFRPLHAPGLGLAAYALDTLQEAFRPLHAPGLGLHRRSSMWRLRFATFPDPDPPTLAPRFQPPDPDLEASNQTP